MIIVIDQTERGLLLRDGKLCRALLPGRYRLWGRRSRIRTVPLEEEIACPELTAKQLAAHPALKEAVAAVEVGDGQIALHFLDGRFAGCLREGVHLFWQEAGAHTFLLEDFSDPEVSERVPAAVFDKLPACFFHRVEVPEGKRARLLFNKKLVRLLEPGTYFFWRGRVRVETELADVRLTRMELSGQEILTRDKASVRINFVLTYRFTDPVTPFLENEDPAEQLRLTAQLALRDYVGTRTMDEILEDKDKISAAVLAGLAPRAKALRAEIAEAGVKDIILPGEIREIMNSVLAAEKRAQANVIARREEVASTRSLLNTARLMEENRTLYRLKELEALEKICENVSSLTLNGGDFLSQLTALIRPAGGQD